MATTSGRTGKTQCGDPPESKPLPTVLLIPGAFSHIHMYDAIITSLRNQGYEVFAYDILTASRKPGQRPATLHEDVAFFSGILTTLCDLGKDVVVLGHSYAGCILTECVRGLTSKRERNGFGTGIPGEGRVVGMVYLAAFAPKVGECTTKITEEAELQFDSVGADGPFLYHSDPFSSARMSFSDLPEAEGVAWAKKFRYQSYLSFKNETEYAGYEDVDKVVFIVTTEDIPLPPRVQMSMVEKIREARKGRDVGVYEVKAGHGAPFTRPELLVPVVLDVLRKEF